MINLKLPTPQILIKGTPDTRPPSRSICTINFTAKLDDNKIVETGENFTFQLSDSEVIQGLDMAIALMDVGEKSEITIASRFAYGELGYKEIPSNSTLHYTVELLEAHEEADLERKTYESRKEIGNKKRTRGNYFFERQDFNLAIQLYRRALEYLDESEGGITTPTASGELEPTNAQLQDLLEDRIKVYNNLAQAQMKIQAFDAALKSIETVLQCQPNNVKALFRKGKILENKADIEGAIPLMRKAAMLEPENKLIQNELSRLILKSKREARNEKDLYQKMLGQANKLSAEGGGGKVGSATRSNSVVASRFKYWSYTFGSILVSVVGIAIYRYKYGV